MGGGGHVFGASSSWHQVLDIYLARSQGCSLFRGPRQNPKLVRQQFPSEFGSIFLCPSSWTGRNTGSPGNLWCWIQNCDYVLRNNARCKSSRACSFGVRPGGLQVQSTSKVNGVCMQTPTRSMTACRGVKPRL